MRPELPKTATELDIWCDQDLSLPVWWRDDDATAPSPALDRLIALSNRFDAPLHLAVIPQPATEALAKRLATSPRVFALPHGWKHQNHAPAGQKKAEFGVHRPVREMLDEIDAGWRRISGMFGEQAIPVFTPPWNRISPEVVGGLPQVGLAAVSTFGPRKSTLAAVGVCCVNTHIDPIAWHDGGGLIDAALLDSQISRELHNRRSGVSDNSEPFGLLTHHLVQDDATWTFISTVLELFTECKAAKWIAPLP